jgi:hypothetical protein
MNHVNVLCRSSSTEEVLRVMSFLSAEAARRRGCKSQADAALVLQVACYCRRSTVLYSILRHKA